jgi:hypothetical protein
MAATRATDAAVRKSSRPGRARPVIAAAGGPATAVIGSRAVRRPVRNGACCASSRRTASARHGAPPWRGEPSGHAPVNPGHAKAEMSYLRSVYHQNRSAGCRCDAPSPYRARTRRSSSLSSSAAALGLGVAPGSRTRAWRSAQPTQRHHVADRSSRRRRSAPGHRRLLFRDCGARAGRAVSNKYCSGPRQ